MEGIYCKITGEETSCLDCKNCHMCMPEYMLAQMFTGQRKYDSPYHMSVTQVHPMTCLRASYYYRRSNYYQDLNTLYIFKRGHHFHDFLSPDMNTVISELSVSKKFGKLTLTGHIDEFDMITGTLFEKKSSTFLPKYDDEKLDYAIDQAIIYKYLIENNENEMHRFKVRNVYLVYLGMLDIKQMCVYRTDDIPEKFSKIYDEYMKTHKENNDEGFKVPKNFKKKYNIELIKNMQPILSKSAMIREEKRIMDIMEKRMKILYRANKTNTPPPKDKNMNCENCAWYDICNEE